MNQLLMAAGIEHWKPVLSMLLIPPVPFLLLALVGALSWRRSRRGGGGALLLGLVLTWASLTVGVGEWLHRVGMPEYPAFSASQIEQLRTEAASGRKVAIVALGAGRERLAPEYGLPSLRRVAQLSARRPDLVIEPLRGNLDTRLRRLDEGQFDAIVLAAAGLMRLDLESRIRARFDTRHMIPCAGQGALGIEVREEATALRAQLAQLVHQPTWLAVQAERAVSRALGGSCSMPLAAYAHWADDGQLQLDVALGHADDPRQPLLRASVRAAVADDEAALALGAGAADEVARQAPAGYLPASH